VQEYFYLDMDAFKDVEIKPFPGSPNGLYGLDYLDRLAGLQIGQGSTVFRGDQSGIWLGASAFADAPFSVDMNGNMTASSATFDQYLSKTGINQAVSGQIIVGGNVNGKVYVKDSSGNIKVQLDQDGITINSGKMTIKDSTDTTIIDSSGLISTANFNYGSLSLTSQPVFTPGDSNWHDITGLSQSFTVSRNVRVLFLMSVSGLPDDVGQADIRMNITGISLTDIPTVALNGSTETIMMTNHRVYVVSSGTITYKLQYRVNSPSTQVQIDPSNSSFLVLGT
jgi:hypothetical protein